MERENKDPFPTRPSLLARLKNWTDEDSWKQFFDTYWKLIYSAALRSGLSESEAEEVVQETVLSIAQTMPGFKYDPAVCSFKSWLMHLTHKRIADQYRKRPKTPTSRIPPDAKPDETATIEQIPDPIRPELERIWDVEWHKNLTDAAVRKVRSAVSSRQYQMFDLYVIKGWSVSDVARTLHVSAGQVYLAKHRVLTLVKKEFRKLEKQPI